MLDMNVVGVTDVLQLSCNVETNMANVDISIMNL